MRTDPIHIIAPSRDEGAVLQALRHVAPDKRPRLRVASLSADALGICWSWPRTCQTKWTQRSGAAFKIESSFELPTVKQCMIYWHANDSQLNTMA